MMNRISPFMFTGVNLLKLIPGHFLKSVRSFSKPLHIIFCMVDHFEPGSGNVSFSVEKKRMKTLLDKLPIIADKHKDSDHISPKRTWFFPPHYHRNNNLRELVSLCEAGYGEIELHLHHGKTRPDTSNNLRNTIKQCIQEYSEFGIFGRENGETRYGFIHGNSALDNSRKGKLCGVNNEIDILLETGCYADFTFPCAGPPNPRKLNSIYYAIDDPNEPKSYNTGVDVKAGRKCTTKRLMIVQGPLFPFFKGTYPWSLRLYTPVINGQPPVDAKRIDAWINCRIHIRGAANWIIVKTHTHGAVESSAVLGSEMEFIYKHLESNYGNGGKFYLHYVSARELYNIIKAIENGEPLTTPHDYRDYLIEQPNYRSSVNISSSSDYLKSLIAKTYC